MPRPRTSVGRNSGRHYQDFEIPTLIDASNDGMGQCVEFVESTFWVEHPDLQFVRLSQLRHFWRLANHHSPQNLPEAQKALAEEIHTALRVRQ